MLRFLPGSILAVLFYLLALTSLVVWILILYVAFIIKWIIPVPSWRRRVAHLIQRLPTAWTGTNRLILKLLYRIDWEISGVDELSQDEWYLLVCNHQSWMDILVLYVALAGKSSRLAFFIKREILYVPLLGLTCWLLDCPFMYRSSKAKLRKNPGLRDKDLLATQRSCERFKTLPVTIINYVEGTRFTPEKHARKSSPYRYLLPPRAGGIAYVLQAMGSQLHKVLNVTIVYPEAKNIMWSVIGGRSRRIVVRVNCLPITDDLVGDYQQSPEHRKQFQQWLNGLWQENDNFIAKTKQAMKEVNSS